MNEITIVIVDDHPLFRQGVADALALEAHLWVVGQAASGEEGLELIRKIRPQIAILDVNLPGMNGQQITRQINSEKLTTRVVLLTAYDDDEQKIHAARAGAAAYCTKDVEPEILVDTIQRVAAGETILNVSDLSAVEVDSRLEQDDGMFRGFADPIEAHQPLSIREMEVLLCVTRGLSNKEIASTLGISHQTVKNHVTAILRKLGVDDRTQAAIYALKRGWVRLHGDLTVSDES
jgi:DNA-binding NarL/FixJ family response regulator